MIGQLIAVAGVALLMLVLRERALYRDRNRPHAPTTRRGPRIGAPAHGRGPGLSRRLPDLPDRVRPIAPRAARRKAGGMTTLSPTEVIPVEVARRLARVYSGIDQAAAAPGQRPALTQAEFALQRHTGHLDCRAAMADCAALVDYRAAHGAPAPARRAATSCRGATAPTAASPGRRHDRHHLQPRRGRPDPRLGAPARRPPRAAQAGAPRVGGPPGTPSTPPASSAPPPRPSARCRSASSSRPSVSGAPITKTAAAFVPPRPSPPPRNRSPCEQCVHDARAGRRTSRPARRDQGVRRRDLERQPLSLDVMTFTRLPELDEDADAVGYRFFNVSVAGTVREREVEDHQQVAA
jgi:hypothetical protein